MTIPLPNAPEKHYWVTDNTGYGEQISSRAGPEQIAANWFETGTWEPEDRTTWVRVEVFDIDETGATTELLASRTFAVDPPEPECVDPAHDWRSPLSVVGGVPESPGTYGHGGGVIITMVCAHCGMYRVEDSWATDPDTGEQGLDSTTYRDPTATSLAWVERRAGTPA